MNRSFLLDNAQFNRLFPFYLVINRELRVKSMGNSISKLCNIKPGDVITQHFSVPQLNMLTTSFDELVSLHNQLIALESNTTGKIKLRGQFEYLEKTDEVLFVGSPWFGTMEEVNENNLELKDFAYHDHLIDLLNILKSHEVTNDDLKKLIKTYNEQKEDLKAANKKAHDFALFPMQNPDPRIRIDFNGELLLNNPAAASFDFIEFEKKTLRNDDFFKLIAERIDKTISRWDIEVATENKYYSFVCVPMQQERYINIYGKEITKEKKIANELRRLSLVASANKNGVLYTQPDGKITWANEGFCKMTGFTLEEVMGKTPFELCRGPLTDHESIKKVLEAFFGGLEFNIEIIYYRKDGSWFWGRSSTQPVKNSKGGVEEYFGIIEDITEEKINEEKMKVLSQIAEDNINAVIIADAEGCITWINKSFTKMSGYSLEEVVGRKPGHLLQGAETDIKTIDYLSRQIKDGKPFNTEIINYHKNGARYWARIQGQPTRNQKGEISGFFALEEDITKEKESESSFKKALENIGDNVWEHDFRLGKTSFSKTDNEFLGYQMDELTNNEELWWNSVVDEDRHLLVETDRKYRNAEADSHSLEYRIRDKDGSVRWVLDRGVVIEKDRNGMPLRITGTHTDITSTKNTETELSNRVKQFQSLSENIPGVIYEYEFKKDGTEGLIYISPAIERIFGIKPDDFKNYLNYIHPDDRDEIIQKNLSCRKTLEPFYCESRLIVPGRTIKWHSVHSSFSYQTENGDNVFTGFILDITERKNAEQKLEEQRKFYEDILNNMPAEIAVFNQKHEYLFVNPRSIKDPDLRKWIIGKKDEDYCLYRNKPLSFAEDRHKSFTNVLETKKPFEKEEKYITKAGEEKYVLRRWFPVTDKNDNVSIVIGYGVDITERKKIEEAIRINEEKYRGIIANMNLGLMEMDATGKIDFANQTLLKMTGLKEMEALGYDAMRFLAEDSVTDVTQRMQKRVDGISEAYEVQTNIKGAKGWWFVSSAPKYASNGTHVGSIVICLDITNQKKLEKELIKSREQAQSLAKAKENFLANMSHEIRTPMNAIIGMGNQLAKTNLSDQQSFYLSTINSAAENLLVIINDILDLSKIEAGKLTIEQIGFEPKKIVAGAMQVLMHKAEEKGLRLTNSFCDKVLSPVLIGDPYRLNQVMLNLLSNAIKFTERGSVDVTCTVIKETATTQTIEAKVIDTGIGMEQEFVDKLFDKFSQEYESVSRKYGGTGLGMSICKELVELMGGKIEVESIKGKGTAVSFTIEFKKGDNKDIKMQMLNDISEDFLKGKTILVTDDNDMNRLVASTILENYGAGIVEAKNGEEAVFTLNKGNIDLILMDIQMPVLNGFDASRIIRKQNSNIPIIALTANAIKGESEKCLAAGMNDYIAKPFNEEEFLKKIAHWLNRQLTAMNAEEVVKEQTSPQLYDLSALNELSRGNKEFILKMVKLFCDQSPVMIQQMKESYASGNFEAMGAVAHKLKPSIDNMRISVLKHVIREIEKSGKDNNDNADLKNHIRLAGEVIDSTVAQLKTEFSI
ncbi:PAS domain S-box protein [Lacibacter luteus]|uniref:Sensory/regulatory protein RpfC n=1 Tax=Lacibacter luteus TaxID=2508719 RepID=A0A4Q1CGZ8_9BACT|nr:PAS domain S-box protein [Lacibacter luteus]RXK59392.1 PAS domain S-box protein [Lacibacter luteus]